MFNPPQPPPLPTPEPPQIYNSGNFGLICMKLGGEVLFRVSNSISAYGIAGVMFRPPQPPTPTHSETTPITNFGNFGLIWMKLGGEV